MTKRASPAQIAWRSSAAFRAIARASVDKINAERWNGPRCGAKKRSDGEPCRNAPMANGRCRLHGGRVPKGKGWHRPQPPADGPRAGEKFERKLRDQEKAGRKRAARIARMTPEQRAAHEAWRRDHRPGDPLKRAADRERRRQDRDAAAMLAAPRAAESSVEAQAIADQLEELRAKLAAAQAASGDGVFG